VLLKDERLFSFFLSSAPQAGVCGDFFACRFFDTLGEKPAEADFSPHIIFLFGYTSRSENDIGSSISTACPGSADPPSLKMIHRIIFLALRAPGQQSRPCGLQKRALRPSLLPAVRPANRCLRGFCCSKKYSLLYCNKLPHFRIYKVKGGRNR